MSHPTYFTQECPTCGRKLRVRVEYHGRRVSCRHCNGIFEACDPSTGVGIPSDSGLALLRRANEILSQIDSKEKQTGQAVH